MISLTGIEAYTQICVIVNRFESTYMIMYIIIFMLQHGSIMQNFVEEILKRLYLYKSQAVDIRTFLYIFIAWYSNFLVGFNPETKNRKIKDNLILKSHGLSFLPHSILNENELNIALNFKDFK